MMKMDVDHSIDQGSRENNKHFTISNRKSFYIGDVSIKVCFSKFL